MAISVVFILAIISCFILGHCLLTQSTNQPYRTAFHFQPAKNWINDPTGRMGFKGLYHLFYQYNPEGSDVTQEKIVWGYSVSKDVVDWTIIDTTEFQNVDSVLRYDYGKYYASKTFFDDATKRRLLLGWVNESSSATAVYVKREWSGIHAIPRAIWLRMSGNQLVQWPVVEVEKLRVKPIGWPTRVLKAGQHVQVTGVTAAQADVEVSFQANAFEKAEVLDHWVKPQILCSRKGATVKGGLGPFGLLAFALEDLKEHTAVFFRIFIYQRKPLVLFCSDQSRSSMNYVDNDLTTYGTFLDVDPSYENLSLRSLIDHSVVESFGGEGRAVITARVYPTMAINDKAQLWNFPCQDHQIECLEHEERTNQLKPWSANNL